MGFGKSMIYTIFTLANQKMRSAKTCILVMSLLKSLIDNQIVEVESLGCTALKLKSDNVESIVKDPLQFVFSLAEKALEKPFLNGLKSQTILHKAPSAIMVRPIVAWENIRNLRIALELVCILCKVFLVCSE